MVWKSWILAQRNLCPYQLSTNFILGLIFPICVWSPSFSNTILSKPDTYWIDYCSVQQQMVLVRFNILSYPVQQIIFNPAPHPVPTFESLPLVWLVVLCGIFSKNCVFLSIFLQLIKRIKWQMGKDTVFWFISIRGTIIISNELL